MAKAFDSMDSKPAKRGLFSIRKSRSVETTETARHANSKNTLQASGAPSSVLHRNTTSMSQIEERVLPTSSSSAAYTTLPRGGRNPFKNMGTKIVERVRRSLSRTSVNRRSEDDESQQDPNLMNPANPSPPNGGPRHAREDENEDEEDEHDDSEAAGTAYFAASERTPRQEAEVDGHLEGLARVSTVSQPQVLCFSCGSVHSRPTGIAHPRTSIVIFPRGVTVSCTYNKLSVDPHINKSLNRLRPLWTLVKRGSPLKCYHASPVEAFI
uniref:Uncharacterized protein n=1 Tax=Steinernema glaseri TaxID=37863 RepID=A0A1I7ZRJ0_9BILA